MCVGTHTICHTISCFAFPLKFDRASTWPLLLLAQQYLCNVFSVFGDAGVAPENSYGWAARPRTAAIATATRWTASFCLCNQCVSPRSAWLTCILHSCQKSSEIWACCVSVLKLCLLVVDLFQNWSPSDSGLWGVATTGAIVEGWDRLNCESSFDLLELSV